MAMNKQRKSSNLLNILNYDDAGNIVLKDYSQTIRYNWNGTIHAFTGPLSVSSIAAAVTDTDRFLVSDGGVLKYRTGAEVLSDIGAIGGSGATGQVAYWNGTSSQTGSNNLFWDAANARLGIGTNTPSTTLDIRGKTRIQSSGNAELDIIDGSNSLRLAMGSTQGFVGTLSSHPFGFFTGALKRGEFSTNGNFILQNGGTFTDSGQRLQVQGDAFIKGSGATSATTALLVQNSAGTQLAQFRNDQYIQIGTTASTLSFPTFINFGSVQLYPINNGNYAVAANATELRFDTTFSGATTGDFGYLFGTYSAHNTSNANPKSVTISATFSPTSGTQTFTNTFLNPTINQTGGANGITRGLYVNPQLTAAADWRSIEWSNNSGWGLYGAGTANNYLNGRLGIGTTTTSTGILSIGANLTGGTTQRIAYIQTTIQSDVTGTAYGIQSAIGTAGTSFTLSDLFHYQSSQASFGGGSVVTSQYGFAVSNNLIGATNNYGFFGNIPNGTNRWNLYMSGTADNYLAGKLLIGTTTVSTFALDVNGTARVSDALTVIKNQNLTTISNVTNTTSGNLSQSIFEAISSNGKCQFGKTSAGYSAFKTLLANDAYLYNVTSGNISILNDFSTGNINFAAGGVSTAQMTLTASGRLLLGTVSELTYVLDVNGGTARMNGSSTSRSGLEVGTMNHQFFATNNAFIAENAFYNGSAFQRVNTGFSSVAYFAGGGFQVGTLPSGSAGTTQASLNQRFFLTNSGTLAISDTISGGGNITLVASAVLQVDSTTKGFLPPRMTTTQKNAIGTPAAGLVVYDNTDNYLSLYNGTNWQNIVSPNSAGNVLIGTTADQGYRVQITSASADSQLNVWGATAPSIRLDNAASGATQRFVIGLATATNNFIQGANAGDVCMTPGTSSALVFGMWQTSSSSEVMRISTSSNVLIGTSTDVGAKLRVVGDISASVDLRLTRTGTSPAIILDQTQLRLVNQTSGFGIGLNVEQDIIRFGGAIRTNPPAGSGNPEYKLGSYSATAPTATGYLNIEVGGVVYKVLAST